MLRRSLAALMGVLAALLAVELVLQCLPVSSATRRNYYIDPLILGSPPGHRWDEATGWDLRNAHSLAANNAGFVDAFDFVPDTGAVALIGDSYVEAAMLDAGARPGPQLAAALGRARAVYAMGAPGSALLDYAERIRWAHQQFGVQDFVVMMEAGDVRQSLCGSGNVHGPCLDRVSLEPRVQTLPPPSLAKRMLSHSALAEYVVVQLKIGRALAARRLFGGAPDDAVEAKPAGAPAAERAQRMKMVERVAERFFERIAPHAGGRLVLVVDGRRSQAELDSPQAAQAMLMQERQHFIAIAAARGATVVDAEAVYRAHWQRSALSLDVGPYDHHLNSLGVALVMQAAAKALQ